VGDGIQFYNSISKAAIMLSTESPTYPSIVSSIPITWPEYRFAMSIGSYVVPSMVFDEKSELAKKSPIY
jgi:hypothetical protein